MHRRRQQTCPNIELLHGIVFRLVAKSIEQKKFLSFLFGNFRFVDGKQHRFVCKFLHLFPVDNFVNCRSRFTACRFPRTATQWKNMIKKMCFSFLRRFFLLKKLKLPTTDSESNCSCICYAIEIRNAHRRQPAACSPLAISSLTFDDAVTCCR